MVGVAIAFDTKAALAFVDGARKQLDFAAAVAITRTAQHAQRDIVKKLPSIFDRPTPTTLRAIRIRPRDKRMGLSGLEVDVYVQDEMPKGVAPSRYLSAEIIGGDRRLKRSERSLQSTGLMLPGQSLVPGKGAQLDQYGNLRGSDVVRILSRVRGFTEQGYRANATSRTTKRLMKMGVLTQRRSGTDYFVARDKRSGEPIGIYQLASKGVVKPVLWFVNRQPRYKARLPFFDLVEAAVRDDWPREIRAALEYAKRTAR